jgi:hypothetical protein
MFNRGLGIGTLILVLSVTAATDLVRAGSLNQESAQATTKPSDSQSDSETTRPIGIIDFYGLRQLTSETLRKELTFKVGDSVPPRDHTYSA